MLHKAINSAVLGLSTNSHLIPSDVCQNVLTLNDYTVKSDVFEH